MIGGIAGSFGGGWLGNKAQEKVVSLLPPGAQQAIGQSPEQIAASQEAHPYAFQAGALAPNLLAFSPRAAEHAAIAGADAITRLMANPITARAVPAAIMARAGRGSACRRRSADRCREPGARCWGGRPHDAASGQGSVRMLIDAGVRPGRGGDRSDPSPAATLGSVARRTAGSARGDDPDPGEAGPNQIVLAAGTAQAPGGRAADAQDAADQRRWDQSRPRSRSPRRRVFVLLVKPVLQFLQ